MSFQKLCHTVLRQRGWTFVKNVPDDLRSFVMIGAPHTSNYDFFLAMGIAHSIGRNPRFVIKNEWVKFPFGLIMKPLGAYGLDRDKIRANETMNSTEVMASLFDDNKDLVLMIAPEGTRKPSRLWKTGFYYIAQKAGVPIVLGFADYRKKVAGLGLVIYPSDFERDMQAIMDFYREISGKVPQKFLLDERFK